MAPIRIGLVGLSSSATTAWASSAHLPYLLSPRGLSKFRITALLNSSVDAARRAIAAYDLPEGTRAYGSPSDLAADPDVDLVVVSTRVDTHYDAALPSVRAGKDVYVEWPLAQDVAHAAQLAGAAKQAGGRTAVGIQGRTVPVHEKIRQLLREGRIGKVLSSEVRAAGGSIDRDVLPTGLRYFADKAIGGNVVTIGFVLDQIQSVLGEATSLEAHGQIQRPLVRIRDPSTEKIVETVTSNVPDLVVVTASLAPSEIVQENATLLARFRRGQPFKGEPALVWSINGEKGEIRVTSDASTALQAGAETSAVRVEVHDFDTDEVGLVEWEWEDWQAELPVWARSIGRLYEDFAEGRAVPTFEEAVRRHEQLGKILDASC